MKKLNQFFPLQQCLFLSSVIFFCFTRVLRVGLLGPLGCVDFSSYSNARKVYLTLVLSFELVMK